MYYQLLNKLDNKFNFSTVSAHCETTCKDDDSKVEVSLVKMNSMLIPTKVKNNILCTD
jgi:hypothetical protein